MSLPSDHADAPRQPAPQARLGFRGWVRWFWRQLTSMRTALFLLLLLALAAIPGSLVPQRSADPNGVVQFQEQHPVLFPILDSVQAFDTYTSVWFSAIYILLFVSLVGCLIPRVTQHVKALLASPPRTPSRLNRMAGHTVRTVDADATGAADVDGTLETARGLLRRLGYRAVVQRDRRGASVSAERGYARESGNLIFHLALLGVIIAVGVGGGLGYTGQRIVVDGQTFVNTLVNYDSFNPGRFVDTSRLSPYAVTLDKLQVEYETRNKHAIGAPLDYIAHVTTKRPGGETADTTIRVNVPLHIAGTRVYLLGNGYAPTVTIRNAAGDTVFHDAVPFISEDANNTSGGVLKVPDGLSEQLGFVGFFYPTQHRLDSGALTSSNPDLKDPLLSLRVYAGDLGLDTGEPVSVYSLDTSTLTPLAGGDSGEPALQLKPGETEPLPNGLGTITLDSVKRYAALEVHHDPAQIWVFGFALLSIGGLLLSLFVPRRRLWVRVEAADDGLRLEYAGLARGEDPSLDAAVAAFAERHSGVPDPDAASASATDASRPEA